MAPSGSEHPTNRRNGRSILASGQPERVAQVRTRRTATPDQPAADPSSLPVSRPRDSMNQRTPSASTGEFFNTICQQRTWLFVAVVRNDIGGKDWRASGRGPNPRPVSPKRRGQASNPNPPRTKKGNPAPRESLRKAQETPAAPAASLDR